MKKELTKCDVYVLVDTPKKAKKLKKVLDMFGEEVPFEPDHENENHNGRCNDWGYGFSDGNWQGFNTKFAGFNGKKFKEVSIKELRNILAKEHLKEGDVVVAGIKGSSDRWVVKFKSFVDDNLLGEYNSLGQPFKADDTIGYFDNFIRYATEAEKELLRVNSLKEQAKEVIKPVKNELTEDDYKDKTWYKSTSSGNIFFLDKSTKKNHGFNSCGKKWSDSIYWFGNFKDNGFNKLGAWKEATHQEVEKALIEEAKRRGIAKGCVTNNSNIHGSDYIDATLLIEPKFIYSGISNNLSLVIDPETKRAIFKDGKWATVIEQDKFAELKEAHKNGSSH